MENIFYIDNHIHGAFGVDFNYASYDEIKYLLSQKTKEERLAIFKEYEYPKDMDFDYDFGNTVIEVRTFFEGSRDSTVCDTLERIIKEEK